MREEPASNGVHNKVSQREYPVMSTITPDLGFSFLFPFFFLSLSFLSFLSFFSFFLSFKPFPIFPVLDENKKVLGLSLHKKGVEPLVVPMVDENGDNKFLKVDIWGQIIDGAIGLDPS